MQAAQRGGGRWVLAAAALALLGQGILLRGGGVSEYHGEVALVATMDAGAMAAFQCPDCPDRTVLGREGLRVVEVGDTGKLLVEALGGRRWLGYVPFMVVFLPWTVDLFASAPALAFGPSVVALKAFALANLALFVAAFGAFARAWWGPRIAALALLLLAFDPFVAVVLRVAPMPLRLPAYACVAMALLLRGRGSARWLAAGGFALGVGLCNSLMFGWCGVGVLAWLALRGDLSAWVRRGWTAVVLGFLFGASPLLLYNVLSDGATLRFVLRNAGGTESGVAPLAWGNVLARLGQTLGSLEPRVLLAPYTGWSLPWTGHGALALAAAGVVVARARSGQDDRALLALPPAILAASPFTLASLGPHHVALAWPFALLAVARGVAALPRRAAVAAVVLWTLGSLGFGGAWLAWQARTGGVRIWSDASARLADALVADGGRPVAVDPQPYYNALYLSSGAIAVRNPFGWDVNDGDPAIARRAWSEALDDPRTVFVHKRLPDGGAMRSALAPSPYLAALEALAAARGQHLEVVDEIREGDPALGYVLLRARR